MISQFTLEIPKVLCLNSASLCKVPKKGSYMCAFLTSELLISCGKISPKICTFSQTLCKFSLGSLDILYEFYHPFHALADSVDKKCITSTRISLIKHFHFDTFPMYMKGTFMTNAFNCLKWKKNGVQGVQKSVPHPTLPLIWWRCALPMWSVKWNAFYIDGHERDFLKKNSFLFLQMPLFSAFLHFKTIHMARPAVTLYWWKHSNPVYVLRTFCIEKVPSYLSRSPMITSMI